MRPRTRSGTHATKCAATTSSGTAAAGASRSIGTTASTTGREWPSPTSKPTRTKTAHSSVSHHPDTPGDGMPAASQNAPAATREDGGGDHLRDHLATLGAVRLALACGHGETDLLGREACQRRLLCSRHYTWVFGAGAVQVEGAAVVHPSSALQAGPQPPMEWAKACARRQTPT